MVTFLRRIIEGRVEIDLDDTVVVVLRVEAQADPVVVAAAVCGVGPDVELNGELVRKIIGLLHQRPDLRVPAGQFDDLFAVEGDDFALLAAEEIPVGRELADLLALDQILEDDFITGNEVALGVAGLDLLVLVVLLLLLVGFGLFVFLLLFFLCLLVFLLGFVLLTEETVDSLVDPFLYAVADVVFGGVLGSFAQAFQELGLCAAADQGQRGDGDDDSFHYISILV